MVLSHGRTINFISIRLHPLLASDTDLVNKIRQLYVSFFVNDGTFTHELWKFSISMASLKSDTLFLMPLNLIQLIFSHKSIHTRNATRFHSFSIFMQALKVIVFQFDRSDSSFTFISWVSALVPPNCSGVEWVNGRKQILWMSIDTYDPIDIFMPGIIRILDYLHKGALDFSNMRNPCLVGIITIPLKYMCESSTFEGSEFVSYLGILHSWSSVIDLKNKSPSSIRFRYTHMFINRWIWYFAHGHAFMTKSLINFSQAKRKRW